MISGCSPTLASGELGWVPGSVTIPAPVPDIHTANCIVPVCECHHHGKLGVPQGGKVLTTRLFTSPSRPSAPHEYPWCSPSPKLMEIGCGININQPRRLISPRSQSLFCHCRCWRGPRPWYLRTTQRRLRQKPSAPTEPRRALRPLHYWWKVPRHQYYCYSDNLAPPGGERGWDFGEGRNSFGLQRMPG